ncbi:hypothetical protein [Gandjariella thermophila]|uniref:Major facilitator superfamily (MFS) profile domain-containing protein n=1 Tax=Gandjariella thermophila TaxID=1931992 RepID=A0A4D4JDH7_9PSEU|nr:hypothetical protein [Gandjariella thermophila]GDY33684.1 hypothetical protein GTS_53170 [Gandjariella thermophila]
MSKEWIVVGLLALAGFLAGGVYSTWRTARVLAAVLAVAALLALGGAAAWYFG